MLLISGWQIRAPSNLTRFVLLALLSVSLMLLDARGHHLQKIRSGLTVIFRPIQVIAAIPVRVGSAVIDFIHGDETLRAEAERLRSEQPILLARLQKFEAIEAENAHLRQLLGTSALVAERAVAAELLEVASEPFRRTVVIAKGEKDGLYLGQPVIDAYGIRGQVSEVGVLQSTAILITDPGHAIPVQVNRNGLRAIAFGTGAPDTVSIRYLTASSDIKPDDLLVSSGIGGGFPFGYPVAKVKKIVNDPNESFLDITATPVAQLSHNREVLLIWPSKSMLPAEAKKPAEIKKPVPQSKPVEPKKPAVVPQPTVVEPAKPAEGATP
ncbi:MAG: cell shape-determining protein MreC [Proteobacteria bacterium]|nr:cell shape-determining protein MreC [Pseudomonadota bacterium]